MPATFLYCHPKPKRFTMDKKIPLKVVGLSHSHTQSGAYALILEDTAGKRRLPIIIGNFEAQSIAIELEKMKPGRPLTHDVFFTVANTFDIQLQEVLIYNLVEGVFYAKLIMDNGMKHEEIDARSSDAIALAVRFKCPIYASDFVVRRAGVGIEEEEAESQPQNAPEKRDKEDALKKLSTKEIEKQIDKAIEEENYELASTLKKELDSRKNQ